MVLKCKLLTTEKCDTRYSKKNYSGTKTSDDEPRLVTQLMTANVEGANQ